MHPVLLLPIGRGLGLVLCLLALGLAVWDPPLPGSAGRPGPRARHLALLPGLAGLALLVVGQVAVFPWPSYGLFMGLGALTALAWALRWAKQAGIPGDVIVEMALFGFVAGLLGGRTVWVFENWDHVFHAVAPGIPGAGYDPARPLQAGDVLLLRTHAGEARVEFSGEERSSAQVLARIVEQAGRVDVEGQPVEALHRGPQGLVRAERGLLLRTGRRGPDARLEVGRSPAQAKLGLPVGYTEGLPPPPLLRALFDLRQGGLTYFGAVIAVLITWGVYVARRGLPLWRLLDLCSPIFPWGTAFGRVGCLMRGCCWGREAGPHALLSVEYPPFSLPWTQMAGERLPCSYDHVLAAGQLTPELERALGPLAAGTPPLHATQLYEGLGTLLVFVLVLAFRRWGQRREGQVFALVVLLQCPLRFAVEHWRRDHDYFFQLLPGYPFTVTQTSSSVLFVLGLAGFAWLSWRGRPLERTPAAPTVTSV